jgi:CheY-like chemotaxis protein
MTLCIDFEDAARSSPPIRALRAWQRQGNQGEILDLGKSLNLLIVEDLKDDVELLVRQLRRGGYDPKHTCVDDAQSLGEALKSVTWDVVLTDCNLPNFSGLEAIRQVRETLGPDIPIIIFSGAIGEESAVEMIKAGAQDYVPKDRPARLPMAIEREISTAELRRKKIAADRQLVLERESFITIVAHDLRSPAQRVETMVQMLRSEYEEKLGDDGKDIISRIERSAVRLRLMLVSLLAYARHGRHAIQGKTASLASTIEHVLETIDARNACADLQVTLGGVNWSNANPS